MAVAVAVAGLGIVVTHRLGDGEASNVDGPPVAAAPAPSVGDELSLGPFAVTVSRFQCAPEGVEGPQRCEAALTVRNDSFAVQSFPTGMQRVAEGFRRFVADDGGRTTVSVNPGTVADVTVVFRLPQTFHPSRLELRSSSRQDPVRVVVRP